MKEDSKEETRKAPVCRINRGQKGSILIDRYFQMPGGGFLARDRFLSRVSATGGPKGRKKGPFRKNGFFNAWARIHGEDWDF